MTTTAKMPAPGQAFLGLVFFLFVTACSPLPRAELTVYTATFEEFEEVSGSILDIVAPYERITRRGQSVSQQNCGGGVTSGDKFCPTLNDAFATIGDPPLVKSYRDLVGVISRFNSVMLAYSNGVSFQIIKQDLDGLSAGIDLLKVGHLAAKAAPLVPVAEAAADVSDRDTLVAFVTENYDLVDAAFAELFNQTGALYSNVASGTTIARSSASNPSALVARRGEIRDIIANWSVLINETRSLLKQLKFAVDNPNNIEVRLRNLQDEALPVHAGFDILRKQISALGTDDALQ